MDINSAFAEPKCPGTLGSAKAAVSALDIAVALTTSRTTCVRPSVGTTDVSAPHRANVDAE